REHGARDDVRVQEAPGEPAEPQVQRAVEPLGQAGPEEQLPHQDEERHRDQHEVHAGDPDDFADEEVERPLGEREAGEQPEDAESGGDVDAGAEEDDEDARHQRQLADGRARSTAHQRQDEREDQHQDEEGDRDHLSAASGTGRPAASSASSASSSSVRGPSIRSTSARRPSVRRRTTSASMMTVSAKNTVMPNAHSAWGTTSGMVSALESWAPNSHESWTTAQPRHTKKNASRARKVRASACMKARRRSGILVTSTSTRMWARVVSASQRPQAMPKASM